MTCKTSLKPTLYHFGSSIAIGDEVRTAVAICREPGGGAGAVERKLQSSLDGISHVNHGPVRAQTLDEKSSLNRPTNASYEVSLPLIESSHKPKPKPKPKLLPHLGFPPQTARNNSASRYGTTHHLILAQLTDIPADRP
ncbi:hypothetical protein SERLA73DRAFT_144538 [Serpula lacrymans var. lacrymans S7.3]|uniref:Uncharacterized protein n=2 Tax=Serpula lacrymans var. lacrymans TaxID=341189 RepID=F8QBX3_SERL3|nr:uncharacterized protein SERLADRAFT_479017 [Serpula lacrymans var. lacrymans S7.9]EGN94092.1 hypothetical protein SERLA73DRAFT_144538 [Serpula lacrymans var. lacrymans S7.3]EGO19505.1 hypothetical protein SERLADRAFT_479017 [Serpula lacrymans var. lacrymans S7.9]